MQLFRKLCQNHNFLEHYKDHFNSSADSVIINKPKIELSN